MFINNNHTKNSVRIILFISFQFQSCTFIKKDTIIIYSISFHCSILFSNPTWWKILFLFYFFILTTFSISQSKRANVGYGLTPLKLSSTPLILFTRENKAIVKSWSMGPFDTKNNKILTMSLFVHNSWGNVQQGLKNAWNNIRNEYPWHKYLNWTLIY